MPEITSRLSAARADHYAIERELGADGMATVYLTNDPRHERKVALNVLKPELAAVVGAESERNRTSAVPNRVATR